MRTCWVMLVMLAVAGPALRLRADRNHWAFKAPKASAVPAGDGAPIDRFIDAALRQRRWKAAPEADRPTLIRRLSLDLRGLPPTLEQVDRFVADQSPGAYEKLIDRMLADPATAERLTLDWLDAARYADTNGYSIDDHRDMWAWRDWVIAAFKANMPYDRFLTEQLAGDLLPNATDAQKIATGFLRNGMNTHEGGTIAEEYRVAYIVDKIDTVGTALMGLTLKCAQCHDHKYDSISQEEYYRFFAFFNTSSEGGKGAANGNTAPKIATHSPLRDPQAMKQDLSERLATLDRLRKEGKGVFAKTVDVERAVLEKQIKSGKTSVMVMDHKAGRRPTHVLIRGQYDKKGKRVEPGVPSILPPLKAQNADQPTRLDLARWLVRSDHPLAARVAVNRYWQMVFGTGLVPTPEDFGTQGTPPSHPKLLDWLAADFQKNGWDVRRLLKQIVLSETYRRRSEVTETMRSADPTNRFLARSPRYRLAAELIRDNALAIGGLLDRTIGGPSVYPDQPEGLWRQVSHYGYPKPFTAQIYLPGGPKARHRRSMYTVWKRTAPPPDLAIFDAPTRETCSVRRQSTNTPLQALVTLNDPQFLEAGRALAQRLIQSCHGDASGCQLRGRGNRNSSRR